MALPHQTFHNGCHFLLFDFLNTAICLLFQEIETDPVLFTMILGRCSGEAESKASLVLFSLHYLKQDLPKVLAENKSAKNWSD